MRSLVKALFPLYVVVALLFFIWLDEAFGMAGPQMVWFGALLIIFGVALNSTCLWLFMKIGKGTPHPFILQTRHLIVVGPYCYVRNPMMWGLAAMITGLALVLGSLGLWIFFALFLVFIAIFIPDYEEKRLLERFGDEYAEYCEEVPRWFPMLHAYHAGSEKLGVRNQMHRS